MRKRAILVLLLAMLTLSLIPAMPVNALSAPALYNDNLETVNDWGDKGDTIWVTGAAGQVTAGADVNIYWDAVKAWDGEKGLLNSTEAEASGEYEVWFDVPEAVQGDHYVWVKDTDTGDTASKDFLVLTKVSVSPGSGLEDDTITVKGYGLGSEKDIAVLMSTGTNLPDGTNVPSEIGVTTAGIDGVETDYEFTLNFNPVEPGSVSVTDGTETFNEAVIADGSLTGTLGGSGTVNYVTGEVSVEFDTAPSGYTAITAAYEYYQDVQNNIYLFTTTVDTDDLGSFVKSLKVPDESDEMDTGLYYIHGYDEKNNTDDDDFTIGAVITLDVEEGPVGTVVEVRGRGFTDGIKIDTGMATIDSTVCFVTDDDTVDGGKFKIEIVIPTVSKADDYDITVDDGVGVDADAEFEVLGLAEIEVDPEFGSQGATINIEGYNFTQISGEEVLLELWPETGGSAITDIEVYETDSKGRFSGKFTVPARSSDVYTLIASQMGHDTTDDYRIDGDISFRIGLMIVIPTPRSAPSGAVIAITGTGFTADETWNATLGDVVIVEDGTVDDDTNLQLAGDVPVFFVPTMDPGTYTLTVLDIFTEIDVPTDFTVTKTTMIEVDPVVAPNDYNVSITGKYFSAEDATDIEFVLYNVTADGDVDEDWDMDVLRTFDADPGTPYLRDEEPAETDADGNFTAWWEVLDDDSLSLGDYWINATDDNDLFAQFKFTLVSKTVDISPRKASFAIGDSVAFDIDSSFSQDDSYIEIMTPDDELYWTTDKFDDDDPNNVWVKVGTIYRVPYYEQTAGGNPMTLEDVPVGTWSWAWYDDDDDELDSGTFTVTAAAADVLGQQITELGGNLEALTEDLGSVTEDVEALSGAVSSLADSVSTAISAANAAKAAADTAADAISDIAETASGAKTAADSAKAAADAAKDSADKAGDAASGLTTLVYGAIGASLIAALAAIVSLMQISRRIAG